MIIVFRCNGCDEVFDNFISITEDHGEIFDVSPCCKSDYNEVDYCECDSLKEIEEDYCPECKGRIRKEEDV